MTTKATNDKGWLQKLFDEIEVEVSSWYSSIPPCRASEEILLTFEEGAYRPPRIVDDPEV